MNNIDKNDKNNGIQTDRVINNNNTNVVKTYARKLSR